MVRMHISSYILIIFLSQSNYDRCEVHVASWGRKILQKGRHVGGKDEDGHHHR